uniref:MI domain-containing protein n=1 Tax=Gongylonema pulchrum TaxID=637853 RepID=A0A183E5Q0_9BILA
LCGERDHLILPQICSFISISESPDIFQAKQISRENLLQCINEDDIEIHRYEKLLGYKKRKSKNMPQVFRAEGLDYVLEMCDPKKAAEKAYGEEEKESDLEPDNDESDDTESLDKRHFDAKMNGSEDGHSCGSKPSTSKKVTFAPEVANDVGRVEGDDEDDVENLKEDIYGRVVDQKTGAVLPSKLGAKEKLDELERRTGVLETEDRLKLTKCLRGLVNRLNEHTLVGAVKSFSDIFASNGHNGRVLHFTVVFEFKVKQILFCEISNSVAMDYRLPDRLIIEYAVFIALIHTTVSSEVSSYIIENFITKLLGTIANPPEGKSLENLCIFLAELYNFKVIKVTIVTEVIQRLREEVSDKCMTCLTVILSLPKLREYLNYRFLIFVLLIFFNALICSCLVPGAPLRSSAAIDMTDLKCLTETQSFLSGLSETSLKEQQLRYVVEEINDIKNANIRQFTDKVDSTLYDHYVSIYRGLTRKMDREKELPMSVDDIVHISERGRWWLVGSAWLPSATGNSQDQLVTDKAAEKDAFFSPSLLQLAKNAKMNTTIRRNIFCTIMSSTVMELLQLDFQDEADAFEKLLRLSLKGQQEREIVHICVHCALREASYNPFYAAVIDHLCCYHKRFKVS